MHLKSHVIMQLALGLTIGASTSACQKSPKTIDEISEHKPLEQTSVEPLPEPPLRTQDGSPNVVTAPEPVAQPKPDEPIGFHGDDCPFCGMG